MRLRVILVRPTYSMNVGMCARAMKNFGFKDLAFVGHAKKNFTSRMYAKHSGEVLDNAKEYGTLEEAAEGFDVLIGTTGVLKRFKKSLKTCISLEELPEKIGSLSAAIAFGSEGNGLTEGDVERCDWTVHIPASEEHPILNLSHAVAVSLYALSGKKGEQLYIKAPSRTIRTLEKKFSALVEKSGKVRNKKKVGLAFKRVLSRALPSEAEAQAMLAALSGFEYEIGNGTGKK